MAISKTMEAALKAFTDGRSRFSVKDAYPLRRKIDDIGKFALLRPTLRVTDTQVVLQDREIPVRFFHPTTESAVVPLIIFFHGGGWVVGNIDSYNRVCAVTARRTGCRVASVAYRLAPEHPFPAGLEDCYEVTKFYIQRCQTEMEIPPEHITLMGDSAGGNLAAAVSLMARDLGEFEIGQQILFYPATYPDHSPRSPFPSVHENGENYVLTAKDISQYMELYLRTPADRSNPYFAPFLASDLSNQPATLMITAELDPLRDEGEAYARALRAAGNPTYLYRMKDTIHGFLSGPAGMPNVRKSHELINAFLNEVGIFETNES